jgi:hypothetical protein
MMQQAGSAQVGGFGDVGHFGAAETLFGKKLCGGPDDFLATGARTLSLCTPGFLQLGHAAIIR